MALLTSRSERAGRYVEGPSGDYSAFIPAPLPPDPGLDLSPELLSLLSAADLGLGRLDGLVKIIPDPDFFVGMYVRREAVLSSQIEGTQSTLEDLLQLELEPAKANETDVQDIVHYVAAMNFGLDRLDALPLSLRLIKEIHYELLKGCRGAKATPGEFRKIQNWIGPHGASIERASFVPPPVPEMKLALGDFEQFLHSDQELPTLLEVGLAHAQFETIHPFLDGNGRVGRLLITLLLVERGVLRQPLLYLSYYFKLHRLEYYDRLTAVRYRGDWEGWMKFFLRGVIETSKEATETAEKIFELRERHRTQILDENIGQNALTLLSRLFEQPLVTVKSAAEITDTSFVTANRIIANLEGMGILIETTGRKRSRVFRYEPYVSLFNDPLDEDDEPTPLEVTEA